MLYRVRLYFKRAELLLEKNKEGTFVLQMEDKILGTFTNERKAVAEFNRLRRDLERTMPPTEMNNAEKRQLLDRYVADTLVKHNSLRDELVKKPPKSRTFG
jgi:hypothetical protein